MGVLSQDQYFPLVAALKQIPSLHYLQIKCSPASKRARNALELLFNAMFSEQFRIRMYSIVIDMSIFNIDTSTWKVNPFLQRLHTLLPLLSCTPQLQSLRTMLCQSNEGIDGSISLSCLERIRLEIDNTKFDQLQLLRKWTPNLRSFRVMGWLDCEDRNYFQENLWRELMHNVADFRVFLEGIEYDPSRTTLLMDYLRNLKTKNWITYKTIHRWIELSIKIPS